MSKLNNLYQKVSTFFCRISNIFMKLGDHFFISKEESYFAWLGWCILLFGFGGAVLWAAIAPLDKGVTASGYVIADSNRKSIQPAFNGIIDEILVREGDQVKSGQVLLKLNPISALAQSNATKESIKGLEAQVSGLAESIVQKNKQLELLRQQLSGVRDLVNEGYLPRNRLLELERTYLQLQSSLLEDRTSLQKYEKQVSETRERLVSYEFDVGNTELKSPVDGQIVNVTIFTKGGVVSAGSRLMEVIPTNESLLIEGQLPVHLVDRVQSGLQVEMMFTAFNANRTPHIPGKIISVGADRIVDEKTGTPYYKIQVITSPVGEKMLSEYKVKPGMPVELFIKLGEQTFLTYLLKPVFDRSHSALREY
jgi:protease secretion system membrane fusion protein